MSYSDDETEKSLHGLEKKIASEYRRAYEGMSARYDEYINGTDEIVNGKHIHHKSLAERFEEEEEFYKAGKYTDEQWESWKLTQIQRGERYKVLANDLAERMTKANETAAAYINDKTPSIYSLNANYEAYEIGKGLEGVSFNMFDEQTVKNMVTDAGNYTEFRTVKVDSKRDYEWNTKQIKSALTSGILQGKSIDKLATSFMDVMKRNRNAAVRNARTAYTSAQNGGRIKSLEAAQKMGINVQKKWVSAHDDRVRMSHALLDGQIRPISKAFDNGLMYPADSSGAPAEVYNCRCTLTYVYPDYDKFSSSEIYESGKMEGETYDQFVRRMNNKSETKLTQEKQSRNLTFEEIKRKYNVISGNNGRDKIYPREEQSVSDAVNFMERKFGDISDIVENIKVKKSLGSNTIGLYDKFGKYYNSTNTVYVQTLGDAETIQHELTHAISSEIAEHYSKFGFSSRNKFMDAMEEESYSLSGHKVVRSRDLTKYAQRNSDEYFSVNCVSDFENRDSIGFESDAMKTLRKYWKLIGR